VLPKTTCSIIFISETKVVCDLIKRLKILIQDIVQSFFEGLEISENARKFYVK